MARTLIYNSAGQPMYLPPPLPQQGDVNSETEAKLGATAEEGRGQRASAESIAAQDAAARQQVAETQAAAQVEAARLAAEARKAAGGGGGGGGGGGTTSRSPDPAWMRPYKNGGPVIKAGYKGTGAVNIGDWTAPMKSRGGK